MFKALGRFLIGKSASSAVAPAAAPPAPPPKSAPAQPAKAAVSPDMEVNPFWLGMDDAIRTGWYQNETNCLIGDFKIEAEDIVLDAGCGDGGHSNFCAKRGAHIILADIDADKVAEAVERLSKSEARKVEAVVSDSNPIPIPDETVTKVVCAEVIEHVADPQQFLSELVRVGKPGARYMLAVPDPVAEHLQEGVAPDSYFEEPNHIRIIERDEFDKMVTDAGLIIEYRANRGAYWTIWWLFFWHCNQDFKPPWHPLLQNWAKTWRTLLDMEGSDKIKFALDEVLPKSQVIVARKPD